MKEKVIVNNIIALGIHIFICLPSFALFIVSLFRKITEMNTVLSTILAIGVPMLYVLCGRLFLRNTHSIKNNLLSVILLVAVIALSSAKPFSLMCVFMISSFGVAFSSFLYEAPGYVSFPVFIVIPSVTLLLGMITKESDSKGLEGRSRD